MRPVIRIIAVILAANMAAPAAGAQAQSGVRLDTPSGYPVPRFVSLKTDETFCRSGPSFSHPIRITFKRKGVPVIVVAETTDHWRKIRDFDGDECWTHKTKLSGVETAIVIEEGLALRARPEAGATPRVRLGAGVVVRVERSRDGWLKLSAGGLKGWAPITGLWGAGASDLLAAPQN